ncbi:biotin carboxylase N-terminal domain-containing protein [Mesorhizobium sp. M1393]|uniref:biotin carboxylase N-terminal domain-containing protein n=1 Tax=unclassified Mesorhizobium TaxID=325217 RepID=UPI00333D4FB6
MAAERGFIDEVIMPHSSRKRIARADRDALHVRQADEAVHIGPAASAQSNLRIANILDAVTATRHFAKIGCAARNSLSQAPNGLCGPRRVRSPATTTIGADIDRRPM